MNNSYNKQINNAKGLKVASITCTYNNHDRTYGVKCYSGELRMLLVQFWDLYER